MKCKVCNADYTIDPETQALIDDGHIDNPELCDECMEDFNNQYQE